MSSPQDGALLAPLDGAALLERAVAYTRASLQLVPDADLGARTPCVRWDLLALLRHMDDSLAAFTEVAEIGSVELEPVLDPVLDPVPDPVLDPVLDPAPDPAPDLGRSGPAGVLTERLRARACALVGAWAHDPAPTDVRVAGHPVRSDVLAAAGSLEIAVHGWDVARACGADRPLPAGLARELLQVAGWLVTAADRPARFAEPVDLGRDAPPGTRLLALLGRS